MEAAREVSRRSDAAASDGAPDDARSDDVASDAVERLRQTLNTPTRWSDHLRMRWGGGLAGRGQLPDVAEEVLGAPRLRTPPTAPGSGGIVAGVAALALLVGIVAGWLGRGAVGAAASAHDAAATPIVADGPQGPGGASTPAPVDGGSVPGGGDAGDAHGDAGAAPLAVHVAGAVARPGLYQVPASARVADVVELAGGAAADADLDRVNLAAPVADGARVFMPRVGQGEPPVPLAPDGAGAGGPAAGGTDPPNGPSASKVDINRADAAALEALPGIGPTLAAAIIEHRTRVGPFRAVEDLLDVSGIGDARLAQLRDLVIVSP